MPADHRCPVFGMELVPGTGRQHDASPTIDRLNPEFGYEASNIRIISLKANRAKGRLTAAELRQIAAWMEREGLT